MCGIVGIYYFDSSRQVIAEDLHAMADRIVHRGPDDAGYHLRGNVGIGMRRLSVIDVAGGHQPIHTLDGRYVIVFNGEVYNFREKRKDLEGLGHVFGTHTDTEVVLGLYAEYGLAFTDHLNGMFGLAIWDHQRHELVVVRDRLGIKPLYYFRDNNKLLFASEIKAILAYPGLRAELDLDGLGAYLKYGFTPPPYTMFRGIRKLAPAHLLVLRQGLLEETQYWQPDYNAKFTETEDQLKEQLYSLLGDSVRRQMIADVPLGAFLSGGFDSSGIVHLMSEIASGPINTYSIGFGKGYEAYNELDAANRFAGDYRTVQHEILVDPDVSALLPQLVASLDEPVADSSFLVTYLVSKLARESVTVILSGVGGDELFGGYRRYLNVTLGRYMQLAPKSIRVNMIAPMLARLPTDRNSRYFNLVRLARAYLSTADLPIERQYAHYTQLFAPEFIRELSPSATAVEDYSVRHFEECGSNDILDKMMYFDLKMSLPEQLLMLTDKMTMAVSLEARVPYLDHRVVEFAARLPSDMKVSGFKLRRLQKEAFRGRIPNYVFAQRKKGFGAPVGTWLRCELRSLVEEVLGEPYLKSQGIFDSNCVRRLVSQHMNRSQDYTDQLLALTVFQLWYRSYRLG